MKGWSTHVSNVTIRQLQRGFLPSTGEQFIKGWSTHVGNVIIRQLQKDILPDTKEQFMKGLSTHVGNVTLRQLQRSILLNTEEQFMKGWSTLVLCAATKHPGGRAFRITWKNITKNKIFWLYKSRIHIKNLYSLKKRIKLRNHPDTITC